MLPPEGGRFRRVILGLLACVAFSSTSWGGGAEFSAYSQFTASAHRLGGQLQLTLHSPEPAYRVTISAQSAAPVTHRIADIPYWEVGASHGFAIDLEARHLSPGDYHLLLEVAFRDRAGANQAVALAIPYAFAAGSEATEPLPSNDPQSAGAPSVELAGYRLHWHFGGVAPEDVRLALTTAPAWKPTGDYTPADRRITLRRIAEERPIPSWTYHQKARLDWVSNGRHHSRVTDWPLKTDANGNWAPEITGAPIPPWWRNPWVLLYLGGLVTLGGVAGAAVRGRFRPERTGPDIDEVLGLLAVGALTAWAVAHASPELWLSPTWSTGGDTAAQVFYAKVFMDWLPTGKVTGWLPESFAGFPAFTFYFPFPFTVAALLQFVVGQPVAFKLASMLPAFLLPAATYLLAASWRWSVPIRLGAALGAAGFLLAEGTSIWGGNALAQLSGEFAYSWGMLLTLVFWRCLAQALRQRGRWWLAAGAVEAAVALSHGYPLLIAGFGAFLYLLGSQAPWRDLRLILRIHTLAFLLAGFWLVPLIFNLPWTIPNDTYTWVRSWRELWPEALWPLGLGLPAGVLALRLSGAPRRGLTFLLSVVLLGLLGFFAGSRWGLADLRFFPFAQWALATFCGAGAGWALERWARPLALPLALGLLLACAAWWEGTTDKLPGWSRWNLSGYENKPMWPYYSATAKANAGPLGGPRLVFEHAPVNEDLGSTRTLEALPLFGSRPALEGLYMESALSGPFIYQMQAEISERPSSPLTRYPSAPRSIDSAVAHLNELYANRLILRSPEKKAQFGSDGRFRLIAEHGPLATYELRDLRTHLVEVISEPLAAQPRDRWLQRAFRRFLHDHPYRERQVYLARGETLPEAAAAPPGGQQVRIVHFSRERIVFETDSPGQPHLVRMTFHPRWRSTGGERIHLAEPAFSLLFPERHRVELVYAWAWSDWLGAGLSFAGLSILALGFRRKRRPSVSPPSKDPTRRFLLFAAVATPLIVGYWLLDPERVYRHGHERFTERDWTAAAASFDEAEAGRTGPARKAEALFWAARSFHLAGDFPAALERYRALAENTPESFWAPESLYREIEILAGNGELAQAAESAARLHDLYPDSRWGAEVEQLPLPRTADSPK